MIDRNYRIILVCSLMGMTLLHSGCQTGKQIAYEDPYLGYVVSRWRVAEGSQKGKALKEAENNVERYQKEIAFKELECLKVDKPNNDRIDRWAEYIDRLNEEVRIDEADWSAAALGRVKEKQQAKLKNFWDSEKNNMGFLGKNVIEAWGKELVAAEQNFSNFTNQVAICEGNIRRYVDDDKYEKAIEEVAQLRKYEEADDIEKQVREAAANWGVEDISTRFENMENSDGEKLEDNLLELYSLLRSRDKFCGIDRRFSGVGDKVTDAIAQCWYDQIIDDGNTNAYWEAYQYALGRVDRYSSDPEYADYWKGMKSHLMEGYNEILGDAQKNFADLASGMLAQNLYGGAYIYCCMADEMYDFCQYADFTAFPAARDWNRKIDDLQQVLEGEIAARIRRRLVIRDYPDDQLKIAKNLRAICKQKYGNENSFVWGLEVLDSGDSATEEDDNDLGAQDGYLVEWRKAEYGVSELRDKPLEDKIVSRRGEPSTIDNPFRKDKSSEFYKEKQIQVQDVEYFEKKMFTRANKLTCKVVVACAHNAKDLSLLGELPEVVAKINNDKYTTTVIEYRRTVTPSGEKDKKYDFVDATLVEEPVPEGSRDNFPEEKEVMAYLKKYIVNQLEEELEIIVSQYPVELLSKSLKTLNSGDGVEKDHFNTMGTVLLYLKKISEIDTIGNPMAGKGYQWIQFRNQIAENLQKWTSGPEARWRKCGMEMTSYWDLCVIKAISLQDE